MNHFLKLYEKYLESKNAAHNTISAYISDLTYFCNFCQEHTETNEIVVSAISADLIRAYILSLFNKKKSNRTISRKITSLKMFFRFLFINSHIQDNPMKKIKSPKVHKKMPRFFTKSEINKLCELPDTTTVAGVRDKAILELFYSSGLRISELLNVKLKDIDFIKKLLIIYGKGSKKRIVPVTENALFWINEYQKNRNAKLNEQFFLTENNIKLNRSKLYFIIKRYINQIALKAGYSPHTIRHSFASHLLNNGADLFAIKEMLGHANLATTEIYTHINPAYIRKEYLSGHPRSEKKLILQTDTEKNEK